MIPDKIYVTPLKISENPDAFVGLAYESDKLLIDRTEYIRKEALLEWLSDMRFMANSERAGAYQNVIDKLNKM